MTSGELNKVSRIPLFIRGADPVIKDPPETVRVTTKVLGVTADMVFYFGDNFHIAVEIREGREHCFVKQSVFYGQVHSEAHRLLCFAMTVLSKMESHATAIRGPFNSAEEALHAD